MEEYERLARERGEAAGREFFGPPFTNFERDTLDKMWDIASQMCERDYHGDTIYDDIEDKYRQLIGLIWAGRQDLRQR